MKVLIDTNILVSNALFSNGLTRRALAKAVESDTDAINAGRFVSTPALRPNS